MATQQVTSQGEYIQANKDQLLLEDAATPLLIEDKPEVLLIEDQQLKTAPAGGVLSDLWNKVKDSTAVHVAEMAATIVKETTTELIEKGKEKAHDAVITAEHAGEKLVAQLSDIQHKAPELVEEKKEQIQEAVHDASIKLQDLSETIVERGQDKAAELYYTAVQTASDVKDQAAEKAAEVTKQASDLLSIAQEKGNEVIQAAADATERAIEQVEQTEVKSSTLNANAAPFEPPERLKLLAEGSTPAPATVLPRARSFQRVPSKLSLAATASDLGWNKQSLTLSMDVVSHIQRIADRTGDSLLHETARRAHSACAKGLSEAPGVHLTWITPQQANDLVNLAIRTQDHELADFARYCQSVAATTHIGVEPTPGKIQEEILKGHKELQAQGRTHSGPGYGAAFASINRTYSQASLVEPKTAAPVPLMKKSQSFSGRKSAPVEIKVTPPAPTLALTMDVVSHIQRIADRTKNEVLHETARKAHSACAKGLSDSPGVHLVWITPQQASELMNLASRTQDRELIDFARYCQSVAATTQVGVEPSPGKIQEEIAKGHRELLKAQGASL